MIHFSVTPEAVVDAFHKTTRSRRWRGAVSLLAVSAGITLISTVALTSVAGAAQIEAHATSASASAFCAKMPSSKVSSIVGWTVTLDQPVVEGSTIACLYQGSSGNVTLEKETGMPASGISTLKESEATHKKLFYASQPAPLPKGTTLSFKPLAALGSNAFFWNGVIEGKPYSGADAFKGTTGYFAEMPRALQTTKVELLERLALSA